MTNKEAVFKVLRSRRWTPGEVIEAEGGLRRLRELRSEGYNIISRPSPDSNYFEYRMTSATPKVTA